MSIETGDYLIVAGIGLIFFCAFVFCCKEVSQCLVNLFRERRVRKKRKDDALFLQRSIEGSIHPLNEHAGSKMMDYNPLEEVPSYPTTPLSPGGWRMKRWNSSEIVYTYPTQIPLQDICAYDDDGSPTKRRETWHGGPWFSRGVDDSDLPKDSYIEEDRRRRLTCHIDTRNWRVQEAPFEERQTSRSSKSLKVSSKSLVEYQPPTSTCKNDGRTRRSEPNLSVRVEEYRLSSV